MKTQIFSAAVCAAALAATAGSAQAETEVSIYSGIQGAAGSTLKGDYPSGGSYDRDVAWDGRSGEMPPYYGIRGTWWQSERLGFGAEFTHSKVYLDGSDKSALGFDGFQLSDGLNVLTANAMVRFPDQAPGVTPYFGGGIGVTLPHVDAEVGSSDTFGYQFGGPAVRLTAGASYDVTETVALFGEYQFTASWNDLDLDNGGSAKTQINTNAVNLGVALKF
ncbi:outer membrane beta-barrel protein [Roseivivax sp. GX 12232]|uniref:outer membrane protein n=1 Tax=Roseivivax sp. GX 12232 TaxID=2900547 RepID=UPI001E35D1FA|nr:outer membrane beta-barrel protein [Roseivivax sp. GX 12232]MCE0505776.1 outer membrane beta-barrel protein [Roseivivax sp. GX 12232]